MSTLVYNLYISLCAVLNMHSPRLKGQCLPTFVLKKHFFSLKLEWHHLFHVTVLMTKEASGLFSKERGFPRLFLSMLWRFV